MLRRGFSRSSVQGREVVLKSESVVSSLLLCLGFSEHKESASNPECLSSMYRIKVEVLANFKLNRSRTTRQHSITAIMGSNVPLVQLGAAQEEKKSSLSSVMALSATELGLAQMGSLGTIALFPSNQFLRYWILQSQWKGFPDRETFFSLTSLSNRPGDTEVSWLSCTWISVVSGGR